MPKRKNGKTFEQKILLLQKQSKGRAISVADILHALSGRGRMLLVMILCLPFCQPIQIPGFSTPFGIAIAFIGMRMAFSKHMWLPKKILSKKISGRTFKKITTKVLWVRKKIKRFVHPRLTWFTNSPPMRVVNGLLICLLGVILALPLPIPLSNLVAAWSIFLICLGELENDGAFIIAGHAVFILTCAFIILVAFALNSGFHKG